MRLFVIARHGESTLNHEQRVNGDPSVPVPLTERGCDEARLLGQQIAHVPFDLCVHSRFERTRADAFPGGESLDDAARRYARAYRNVLGRSEERILVLTHEIPLRYAIN